MFGPRSVIQNIVCFCNLLGKRDLVGLNFMVYVMLYDKYTRQHRMLFQYNCYTNGRAGCFTLIDFFVSWDCK